jgi:hypothetical protein
MATSSLQQTTFARRMVAQRMAPPPWRKDQQTAGGVLIQTAGLAGLTVAGRERRPWASMRDPARHTHKNDHL